MFWGKNKSVRDMDPKANNIYTIGAGSLHIIFHSGKILYFVVERCYIIALLFRSIYNFFLLLIFCFILKEAKTIYFCWKQDLVRELYSPEVDAQI